MARKRTPTRADESEAIPTGTLERRRTEAELKLPLWLRGNHLPRCVADPVEQVFSQDKTPPALQSLRAFVLLAGAAEFGIMHIRGEQDPTAEQIAPATFVQNVGLYLRVARDDVLKHAIPSHVAVVSDRLERLIEATNATLDALMGAPLYRILTCESGAWRMLPGPWVDAMKRSADASQDAYLLMSFLRTSAPDDLIPLKTAARHAGVTAPTIGRWRDVGVTLSNGQVVRLTDYGGKVSKAELVAKMDTLRQRHREKKRAKAPVTDAAEKKS